MKSNIIKLSNITVANKSKFMKTNLGKLSRILNDQSLFAGFTLIELLIAVSLTTVVTGLAGTGVVAIAENNKKAQAETERRVELNRALDFISDEVRQAKFVAKDASATLGIVAPGFDSSNKTPILTLQIPGVSQRVIYYIESSGSDWLGPKVVSRWGPKLGSDGKYTNATNVPVAGGSNNPAGWEYSVLVDLIVDSTLNPNPTCAAGWSLTPSVAKGFYACVDPSGRIAEPHLRGKLRDAYGNFRTKSFDVTTKTFARSFELAAAQGAAALAALEDAIDDLVDADNDANAPRAADDAAKAAAITAQAAADTAAAELKTANDNVDAKRLVATAAATTAANTPTAANYNNAARLYDELADLEEIAAAKATAAQTTAATAATAQTAAATAATARADAEREAAAKATAAQTAADRAIQASTEQAGTNYATTQRTTATQAISEHTAAAQGAEERAADAQTAATRDTTAQTAAGLAFTTNTNDAIAADQRAAELRTTAAEKAAEERAAAERAAVDLIFTTSNGTVTFAQNSTARFEILGGSMYCPGVGEISTTTTLKVTPQGKSTYSIIVPSSKQPLNALGAPGTQMSVTGFANNDSCAGTDYTFDSKTNSQTQTQTHKQVWTLRNGDSTPPFAPAGTQPTIDEFLKNYLDANKKVKLAANQVIYLFELYTTDRRSENFDMQDVVVLATVEPTLKQVCTVPNVVGMSTSTNTAISNVNNKITPNLVSSGTGTTTSNSSQKKVQTQSPPADQLVECGSTVSYTYKY